MKPDEKKLKDRIERAKTPEERLQAKFELGKLYNEEGKYSQAIEIFEEIEKHKNNRLSKSQLLSEKALSYYMLDDKDMSASLYGKVLSINREVVEDRFLVAHAALELGIINYTKSNLSRAFEYFKRSQKYEDSFDDKAKYLLYAFLGRCYYDLKNYTTAIVHYKKSIELHKKTEKREDWLYGIYEELGWCYYRLEQYEEAIGIYKNIESEYPTFSRIYYVYRMLAFSLWGAKKYKETVECLEKLIKMGPEEKDVAHFDYYIGTSYYMIGEYKKAKAHLTRFMKLGCTEEWMVENAKQFLAAL